jgi:hypothetical protein
MSTNGQQQAGSRLADSVDQMIRWPLQMTGATWDLMMQGMQSLTGTLTGSQSTAGTGSSSERLSSSSSTYSSNRQSGPSWTSLFTGQSEQDLSGDDLKYVIWSIIFTKPGYESVLEPQHEEIVNYSADGPSFAAVKIAKFLEKTRHGRVEKPEAWGDKYPAEPAKAERRTETSTTVSSSTSGATGGERHDRGWRIPAEDHKYIAFLYRVDRRLPKQDAEVTRVERVTVERGPASKIA